MPTKKKEINAKTCEIKQRIKKEKMEQGKKYGTGTSRNAVPTLFCGVGTQPSPESLQ